MKDFAEKFIARGTKKWVWDTPDDLVRDFQKYIDWNESNPIKAKKIGFYLGDSIDAEDNRYRMPSIRGFFRFIGRSRQLWIDYRDRPGFNEAIMAIEDLLYAEQVEKAAAGFFHAGMVMSLNNIRTKVDNDHTSSDGSMTPKDVDQKVVQDLSDMLTGKK